MSLRNRHQVQVDAALAAARDRVTIRAERLLVSPDFTAGRWWRQLQEELDGAGRRRSMKLIKAWERHVTAFLEGIEIASEVAFGERETDGLADPADWRAGV